MLCRSAANAGSRQPITILSGHSIKTSIHSTSGIWTTIGIKSRNECHSGIAAADISPSSRRKRGPIRRSYRELWVAFMAFRQSMPPTNECRDYGSPLSRGRQLHICRTASLLPGITTVGTTPSPAIHAESADAAHQCRHRCRSGTGQTKIVRRHCAGKSRHSPAQFLQAFRGNPPRSPA